MNNQDNRDSGIAVEGGFSRRLDNFWYHYKWHTIAALFVIVVISVCVTQCATNTRYDIQVLYAGNHAFGRTSENGGFSEHSTMISTLSGFAEDTDGNGDVAVSFLDLYLLTKEEIAELEKNPETNAPASYQLLQENTTMLKNNLDMSEYYVCFLSERLFRQYSEGESNMGRFARIESYTAEGREYDYVSEYGIRLSSLDIKDLPGFDGLDAEDTVVCIRQISAMSSMFTRKESERHLANGERMLRALLSYEK